MNQSFFPQQESLISPKYSFEEPSHDFQLRTQYDNNSNNFLPDINPPLNDPFNISPNIDGPNMLQLQIERSKQSSYKQQNQQQDQPPKEKKKPAKKNTNKEEKKVSQQASQWQPQSTQQLPAEEETKMDQKGNNDLNEQKKYKKKATTKQIEKFAKELRSIQNGETMKGYKPWYNFGLSNAVGRVKLQSSGGEQQEGVAHNSDIQRKILRFNEQQSQLIEWGQEDEVYQERMKLDIYLSKKVQKQKKNKPLTSVSLLETQLQQTKPQKKRQKIPKQKLSQDQFSLDQHEQTLEDSKNPINIDEQIQVKNRPQLQQNIQNNIRIKEGLDKILLQHNSDQNQQPDNRIQSSQSQTKLLNQSLNTLNENQPIIKIEAPKTQVQHLQYFPEDNSLKFKEDNIQRPLMQDVKEQAKKKAQSSKKNQLQNQPMQIKEINPVTYQQQQEQLNQNIPQIANSQDFVNSQTSQIINYNVQRMVPDYRERPLSQDSQKNQQKQNIPAMNSTIVNKQYSQTISPANQANQVEMTNNLAKQNSQHSMRQNSVSAHVNSIPQSISSSYSHINDTNSFDNVGNMAVELHSYLSTDKAVSDKHSFSQISSKIQSARKANYQCSAEDFSRLSNRDLVSVEEEIVNSYTKAQGQKLLQSSPGIQFNKQNFAKNRSQNIQPEDSDYEQELEGESVSMGAEGTLTGAQNYSGHSQNSFGNQQQNTHDKSQFSPKSQQNFQQQYQQQKFQQPPFQQNNQRIGQMDQQYNTVQQNHLSLVNINHWHLNYPQQPPVNQSNSQPFIAPYSLQCYQQQQQQQQNPSANPNSQANPLPSQVPPQFNSQQQSSQFAPNMYIPNLMDHPTNNIKQYNMPTMFNQQQQQETQKINKKSQKGTNEQIIPNEPAQQPPYNLYQQQVPPQTNIQKQIPNQPLMDPIYYGIPSPQPPQNDSNFSPLLQSNLQTQVPPRVVNNTQQSQQPYKSREQMLKEQMIFQQQQQQYQQMMQQQQKLNNQQYHQPTTAQPQQQYYGNFIQGQNNSSLSENLGNESQNKQQ